ncbi:MAG TPA: hypothetical protein VHY08_20000 [Bacillota bacterium]|nr:hypothetical protein [Bacillota bacterium]
MIIVAINNTLTVVLPNGKVSEPIAPTLKFSVDDVLKGKNLY